MITKEQFTQYIIEFQNFQQAVERIEEAISGSRYGCNLWETDWHESVCEMLEIFLTSHFTVEGADWVSYYLWEDIDDKIVTVNKPKDIFNEEQEIKYHLNSIDELWNFLLTDTKLYFKNV
jgi:hypothetical protein